MTLREDQQCRYMQHIMIPEISGQGQKKILNSSVILFGENVENVSLALYYLAAAGVGKIYCNIDNPLNWEDLSDKLSDLNSDAKIQLQCKEVVNDSNIQGSTRIIIGGPDYVPRILKSIAGTDHNEETYIPTIVSFYNSWRGAIQTFTTKSELVDFLLEIDRMPDFSKLNFDSYGHKLSGYFLSLLSIIEHLKYTLTLGKLLSVSLYHDLSTMEFHSIESTFAMLDKLNAPTVSKNLIETLADSKALIVGCGGLGSSAAYALSSLGIGRLGLLDPDIVDLSNLNRQIMHSFSRIGMTKVQSAEIFLKAINPDIRLDIYNSKIEKESIQSIISSYDIILGCLDDQPDRYILNDACRAAAKPLLEAGALDISGLATLIIPDEEHCQSCSFPESNYSDSLLSGSESGVLGPVSGLMGIIQAAETVKHLTDIGSTLKNKILLFDVFDTDIYIAAKERTWHCEFCSNKHSIA